MNEQRRSTHEGIWIGPSVLLVLVTAAAGAYGFVQLRHARAVEEMELVRRRELGAQAAAHQAATDLFLKVRKLEQRVGELEAENHDLRTRLELGD